MKRIWHYVYILNSITESALYIFGYVTEGPGVRSNIGFRKRILCSVEVYSEHNLFWNLNWVNFCGLLDKE